MSNYDDMFKNPPSPKFDAVPWLVVLFGVALLGFSSYIVQGCG